MTKLNGNAAEHIIAVILTELGFIAKCPVTRDQILEEIEYNTNKHYTTALDYVEKECGTLEVSAKLIADYALGVDLFVTDNNEDIATIDIFAIGSNHNSDYVYKKTEHKNYVRNRTSYVRKRLGFGNHLLVKVDGGKTYNQLTNDDKWNIIDTIMEAYDNNKKEVLVKF